MTAQWSKTWYGSQEKKVAAEKAQKEKDARKNRKTSRKMVWEETKDQLRVAKEKRAKSIIELAERQQKYNEAAAEKAAKATPAV